MNRFVSLFSLVLRSLITSLLMASGIAEGARCDEARLPCIADTTVSSYATERDFNYGHAAHLRVKGIEMIALLQFDTAPVRGWVITRATLHLRHSGQDRKLRTLGFSTISAPWQEGAGAGERRIGECCFNAAALGKTPWRGPQSDFTDVSYTAGHTIAAYADIREGEDGWFTAQVDPRIVQALAAGLSYGLSVSDEKGQTAANNDVFSREQSGSAPFLVVEGRPNAGAAPGPVTGEMARPDPAHADFTSGAVQVQLVPPPGALGYTVEVAQAGDQHSSAAARSEIPFAEPGKRQAIVLRGLPPAQAVDVAIQAVGPTGAVGDSVRARGLASPPVTRPRAFRRAAEAPATPRSLTGAGFQIWALPDTEKANPVTGNVLEEVGAQHYGGPAAGVSRSGNAVWRNGAVVLSGARSEIVAFQLIVECTGPSLKQVGVEAPGMFRSPSGAFKAAFPALYREWYVRDGDWFPEVCVPLTAAFDVPCTDNAVPGQRGQAVYVEFQIPRAAQPGNYESYLSVVVPGARPVRVPIRLTVRSFALPDRLSFDVSLNGYGTVGGPFGIDDRTAEYRALEREYHRMAHAHRCTLALLGYSHTGRTSTNYAPPLEGSGAGLRVQDWSGWDTQFGGYLDGSAFHGLPRDGVPISHLYLPFHEAWPVDIRSHYAYRQTVAMYPEMIAEHALKAPPIEEAVGHDLADGFTAVARQFAEHVKARGWTSTMFQFYQNDKHYYKDPKMGGAGTSWWLLDEPNHRDDWLALAYFARLWRAGVGSVSGSKVRMVHREDISRPQWQRDYLDGLVDLMVVSGELTTKGPRLREMQERLGVTLWNYGAANAVRRSNTEAEAWAVRAWLAGADAIVPWQSIGTDENYTRPDETALLLPGKRFGLIGPVASLRLKALCRAQQDVEYLAALAAEKGWSREQVAAAVGPLLRLKASFQQANDQDAGNYQFGAMRSEDFAAMCTAAAAAPAMRR